MIGLGSPHLHLFETGSTNDKARELAEAGAPHGTMVSAVVQTAGRGRQGREWTNPAGVMAQSFVLRPDRCEPALLPIAAAVATASVCGSGALIKWPNDIWLTADPSPRKVAGILIETRMPSDWFVLGIGVNVAVDLDELGDAAPRAATLGQPASAMPVWRRRLVDELDRSLSLTGPELLDRWRERDGLCGREVAWDGGSGVADGIDAEGHLLVRGTDGSLQALVAGEVHLRPLVP